MNNICIQLMIENVCQLLLGISCFVPGTEVQTVIAFCYVKRVSASGGIAPNQVITRSEFEVHNQTYKE